MGESAVIFSYSDIPSDPRILRQIRVLKSLGYDIHVVGQISNHQMEDCSIVRAPKPSALSRYISYLIPNWKIRSYLLHERGLSRDLQAICNRAKLIVVNEVEFANYLLENSNFEARLYVDLHEFHTAGFHSGLIEKITFSKYRRWQLENLRKLTLEFRKNSLVLMSSVSEEISENLSQFFNFPFFVVPNFPSSLLINETARNSRNEIQFVHHGMGRKNRGIETLIKAFAKVPSHVRLQLMLRTGFLFRMKIAALIIFHGLQDRVRLVQPVKYADLLFKLREFDASIVPGSDATDHDLYALPNKLFESIQARLPLIVGPNPSVANIVLKYNVGLVAKDWNAESFANEINRILPLLSKHDFQKNLEVAALELNSAVIETELASQIKWVCG